MSRRAARPTQAEISRAVKAVQATGLQIARVEIDGGKVVVLTSPVGSEPTQPQKSAYQLWREKQRAIKEHEHSSEKTS